MIKAQRAALLAARIYLPTNIAESLLLQVVKKAPAKSCVGQNGTLHF